MIFPIHVFMNDFLKFTLMTMYNDILHLQFYKCFLNHIDDQSKRINNILRKAVMVVA
jgi:hypothetical protein